MRSSVCDRCGSLKPGGPCYTRHLPKFDNSIQLPNDCDHLSELLNVDNELLEVCLRRIAQQRMFDKKPLGLAVLWVPTPSLLINPMA